MVVPTRGDAGVELRRYFLGSGHHVVVTTVDTVIRRPSWSPDGRWVALQTSIPGTTRVRVYVLEIETGQMLPVDLRRGEPGAMTWSGPFLIYVSDVAGPDPVLMSWDSRTQRRATVERAGLERFLAGPISAARCDSASV
jgi:Tol biopolymer transport system component